MKVLYTLVLACYGRQRLGELVAHERSPQVRQATLAALATWRADS